MKRFAAAALVAVLVFATFPLAAHSVPYAQRADWTTTIAPPAQAAPAQPAAAEPAAAAPVAAEEDNVVVPWGMWLQQVLGSLSSVLLGLAALAFSWFTAQMPALLRPLILTFRGQQLLENAVRSAMAQVAGAVEGKTLEIPVANNVLRQAIKYALANGSQTVLAFIGAEIPALTEKLLARMTAAGVVPPGYSLNDAVDAVKKAPNTPAKAKAEVKAVFDDLLKSHLG